MVTYKRVKGLFKYNPFSGNLIRRITISRSIKGSIAGCTEIEHRSGYKKIRVSIDNRNYLAHRIIWLLMTGKWPLNEIDHIDRNATNNRWLNLREATHSQGMMNKSVHSNNKLGVKGIRITRWGYQTEIGVNDKHIHLGYFKTLEEAKHARHKAVIKYHGEFARLD